MAGISLELTLAVAAAVPIPGNAASSSSTGQLVVCSMAPQSSQAAAATTAVVGVGSSFLKMFIGNAAEMMFLPRGYTIEPEHLSKHWFSISAPSGSVYKVWMESYLDGLVLRKGWSDLMDREGVSQGDIGLFTRTDSLAFSLTIMSRTGLQKRPEPTDLHHRFPVVRWEDVKFFTSEGLEPSHAIADTLYSLWVRSKQPFVLYAARMEQSDLHNGFVSFTKKLSTRLPAGPAKIGLVFNGSRLIFEGIIQKRGDQVARIHGEGWIDFARANDLRVGLVYVYKFQICDQGWQVTLHQV